MAESGVVKRKSDGHKHSDLPSLSRRIDFIQWTVFKVMRTLYNGIEIDGIDIDVL